MAEQNLKINVFQVSDTLKVEIINKSYSTVLINKRFSLGQIESKRNELSMLFKNENNQEFKFNAKIKIGPAQEKDLVSLSTDMYIGRIYKLSDLADYFDLVQGRYKVKVFYHNSFFEEKDAFIGTIESDWADVIY